MRDGCAYDDPAKYLRTMAEPQRSQFAAFAVEHLAHGALPAIVDIGPISAAVAAVN